MKKEISTIGMVPKLLSQDALANKMTIAELIEREGGNAAFSRALGIPLKTVESWKSEKSTARRPPEYNVRIYKELLDLRK